MNEITIKSGTRDEIVEYVRQKIKRTLHVTSESFGTPGEHPTPWEWADGDFYELDNNPIEKQIDDFIDQGIPLVHVSLWGNRGSGTYRDKFIVTDYAQRKIDRDIERLDNPETYKNKMSRIKLIIGMELDAEERWKRILKVVEEFEGKTMMFGCV